MNKLTVIKMNSNFGENNLSNYTNREQIGKSLFTQGKGLTGKCSGVSTTKPEG